MASKDPLCRFCKSPLKVSFVDLGQSPVSNAFLTAQDLNKAEPFFPLHARVCSECFLVQIDDVETADHHFHDNYAYFSSVSSSWVQHAENYVEKMMKDYHINSSSRVIEIASNDGYLLQHFVKRNVPCLGIEPSANTAREAEKKGVHSVVKFFGVQTAQELGREGWKVDLLLGNNVVAHVPDINDFVGGMKVILKPDGLITLEFPHLYRLMEENQFDTIYHEHFSYFSLYTISRIFEKHELKIFDVEELKTHGGSLRIYARHAGYPHLQVTANFKRILQLEKDYGLLNLDTYRDFGAKVMKVKNDLINFLSDQKRMGKSVVAYGAPAKGNTLLNYCGVKTDLIKYTVDRSDFKKGRYLPGTHIPIFGPEKILESKPDFVLILPWNLRSEIAEQMKEVRSWGGRFVVPIPELRVIE